MGTPDISTAESCLRVQDFPRAKRLLLEALYENPDNLEALWMLGVCYTETGDQAAALRTLGYYFEKHGQDANAFEAIGCTYLRLNLYEKAEYFLTLAGILAPQQGSIHRNIGVLFSITGRNAEAYEALKCAESCSPHDILTLYALGPMHAHFKNHQEARNTFDRLLQLNPPAEIKHFAQKSLAELSVHPAP